MITHSECTGAVAKHGWVYVLELHGLYKIGMSRKANPQDRLKQIDRAIPWRTRLVALESFSDARFFERLLHRHFAEDRVRGEWFDLGNSGERECKVLIRDLTRADIVNHSAGCDSLRAYWSDAREIPS